MINLHHFNMRHNANVGWRERTLIHLQFISLIYKSRLPFMPGVPLVTVHLYMLNVLLIRIKLFIEIDFTSIEACILIFKKMYFPINYNFVKYSTKLCNGITWVRASYIYTIISVLKEAHGMGSIVSRTIVVKSWINFWFFRIVYRIESCIIRYTNT